MNLLKLAPALAEFALRLEGESVTVESARCVRHWNRDAACSLCVDGCPTGAITFAPDGVVLASELCVQCGYCLHACPTGAFAGVREGERVLRSASTLPEQTAVELLCAHNPAQSVAPGTGALVKTGSCLAALGPATYVGLATLGVARVGVRLERCAACPIAALRTRIEAAIHSARALTSLPIEIMDTLPAGTVRRTPVSTRTPPVSRRGLLRRLVGGEGRPDSLPPPPSEGKAPPHERRLLLHGLQRLPPTRRAAGPFFPMLAAEKSCTACTVCATVCPTGALRSETNDGHFALRLNPAACTGCGLCVELCGVGALQAESPVAAEQTEPVTLLETTLKVCARCHVAFAGEGKFCPTCDFRRKHPAGSLPRPPATPRA